MVTQAKAKGSAASEELGKLETFGNVSNDAESTILLTAPYIAEFDIVGTAPILFHKWSTEAIDARSKAAKGSAAKKTDDPETFIYRNEAGEICLPGEYIRQSILQAAKYRQDPRSPRKSAMDLFKAGIAVESVLCPLGTKNWDYLDARRAVVMRSGITRTRPAFNTGWKATCSLLILTPEYIPQDVLLDVLTNAGRLVGTGDFRPTFGRYQVTGFRVSQ